MVQTRSGKVYKVVEPIQITNAVMKAIQDKDPQAIKLIMTRGFDPNMTISNASVKDLSPLNQAIWKRNSVVAHKLLEMGARVTNKATRGGTEFNEFGYVVHEYYYRKDAKLDTKFEWDLITCILRSNSMDNLYMDHKMKSYAKLDNQNINIDPSWIVKKASKDELIFFLQHGLEFKYYISKE